MSEEHIDIINDDHERHELRRRLRARRQMKMSVIFGIRNRAQYAKKVIRSLLVQDLHRDFYEIIIVDCESADDLKEYLDQIAVSNIRLIRVPKSKQYDRARALNIGANIAQHRILVFTEADLLFPKYALRMIRDHVINNEKQVAVVEQKNLQKLETAIIIGKTYSDYGEMLAKVDLDNRPSQEGCIVIERPEFEEVQGFDEDYVGEAYEITDFVERLQQNGVKKQVLEKVHVLHMWHNVFKKENEGYFWELYNRKKQIATPVRNQNRKWGVIVPKRPRVLFMLSPNVWEPGSICKHIGDFLHSHYQVDMYGARDELRAKTSKKYDIVFTVDWRLPKRFRDNTRLAAGVFDYISWNDGTMHNVVPNQVQDRLELFDALAVPCRDLKEIFFQYHPNTFYTPVTVDTELFRPLQYKRRVSNDFTVGWAGKSENHTVEGYLEHIKPVCNQIPGVTLFTAPGGEDVNGPTQMLAFYNAIDVLVVFHETMGDMKTILEAMACGTPVITTRVSDVDEVIENNVNGIIIPRNEEALIESIQRLKDRPQQRMRMGQMARATVVQRWDWRDKIFHWKEFFDAVMEIE